MSNNRNTYNNEDFVYMCKLLQTHEIVLEKFGSHSIALVKAKNCFQGIETISEILNSYLEIKEEDQSNRWVSYNHMAVFSSTWIHFKEEYVFGNPVKAIIHYCENIGKDEPTHFKSSEVVALDLILYGVKAGSFYCYNYIESEVIDKIKQEYKENATVKITKITDGILTGERREFINAYINDYETHTLIYTQINSRTYLPQLLINSGFRSCSTELKTSPIYSLLQKEKKPFHHTDLHPESETLKQFLELSEKMTKAGLTLTHEQENILLHNVIDELSAEIANLKLKIEDMG